MNIPVSQFVNTVGSGGTSTSPFITIITNRAPTTYDVNYQVTQRWVNNAGYLTANITGATNANPCVITADNFFQAGQLVKISGVGGMTQLNNNSYPVLDATGSNFTINVDSTGFGTYTSGGIAVANVVEEYILLGFTSAGGTVQANWAFLAQEPEIEITLTGNSGGPVPPNAEGNFNTVGSGSITIAGSPSTNTLTTELTGLTNHYVLVGAGTPTITSVSPSTATYVLTSNGTSLDPSFQNISAAGAITSIVTDSGTATPSSGVIDLYGQTPTANVSGVKFTASGNVIDGTLFSPFVGDFNFKGTTSGTAEILQVSHSSNTSGSTAVMQISSAGTSGGDPYVLWNVGTTAAYAWGIDNANSQALTLAYAASGSTTPTAGTQFLVFGTSGFALFPTNAVGVAYSSHNALSKVFVQNTDTTSTGSAVRLELNSGAPSGGGGDAYILVDGSSDSSVAYELGYQQSSGNFVIQYSPSNATANMDGSTAFSVSNSGVVSISTYTMPTTSGTSNYVLTTNGTSAASWAAVSATGAITTIDGDSGSCTPSSGVVTISGGTTGLTTSGSSHTLSLTGTLKLANGGTNANLTASDGGIFYSTASAGAILSGTATANQMLQSGASTTPAWSTTTWPATTLINTILYSSSASVIGQITAADNGVLISGTTGIPSWLANSGTPGYVLTANSSLPPSWQATAASSITITGDSGGGLTGNSFTFTGGTTGLTFSGATTTETLGGILNPTHGGTGVNNGSLTITLGSGSTGYVLTSDSSGNATWQSNPGSTGFSSVNMQVFTYTGSSQTYTPTAGMVYCIIEVVGGGGGGGGAPTTTASQVSEGGGGGAGEYARGVFTSGAVGSSQTVTIGAAGASNSGTAGGNGGTTSVGVLITAGGGTGGATAAAGSANIAAGGAGGTGGSGGSFRCNGQSGYYAGAAFVQIIWTFPFGGSSQFGAGGVTASASAGGATATGYGAGGSGTINNQNNGNEGGGAGTAGIVIITEYIA